MLGNGYIKFNGETIPNPYDYSDNLENISNTFQSEAGDDLVLNIRQGKYSGDFTFHVSSYWKKKLKNYSLMPAFILAVDSEEYEVRIDGFNSHLVSNSEHSVNTDGYWEVTFSAIEF